MKWERSSFPQAAAIELEGFLRQQMNRYGVTRKGVESKYVKNLAALPLQFQASITYDNLHVCWRLPQEIKQALRDVYHLLVDFVKAIGVASLPVGGNCARAETD